VVKQTCFDLIGNSMIVRILLSGGG
jgi:hypothetical protein